VEPDDVADAVRRVVRPVVRVPKIISTLVLLVDGLVEGGEGVVAELLQGSFFVQGNLATSYMVLGRDEDALRMQRDVYSGRLKLSGEENRSTILTAHNYASMLNRLKRFEEARSVLRKTLPVARRVLGDSNQLTLDMRWTCTVALCNDPDATLDDIREGASTLEDAARIARRVLGGTHPTTAGIERALREARAALHAHETPPPGSA
jgi:hypothetical protein